LDQHWEALKRWVSPDPSLPLEKRFFIALCLLGGLVSIFVVVPVNQFQNLSPWVDRVVFVFGLVSLGLGWLARGGRFHRKTMLFSVVACLDLVWFANGGSQGSIGLYFFSAALFLVLFFEGSFRYIVLGLVVANIIGLHLAEHAWPQLVHPFSGRIERLLDLSTGYVLSMLICALMLWVVLAGFNLEKERLKAANEALAESEEKFSRIFEENPDAVLILDPATLTILEANTGFERMFGLPRKESIGRAIQEIGCWADPSGAGRILAESEHGGKVQGMEIPFRRADGSTLWGEVSLAPVHFGAGVRQLLTIRDVTERYRSAEFLADSERLYRELLERQGEGFAVADTNERFMFTNPRAEQIFGVPPGGLLGRSLMDFLEPEERRKVEEETRLRTQHKHSTYELRIRRPDGETRMILVTATPGRLKAGEAMNIIGVFRDITEEKQAEEAKRRHEEELHQTQKMDSLGILAGGVAHDFNNMLGGIMGYADLLLSSERDPRRQEHLRAIILAASRSGELTRKLLAFGRRGKNLVESLDLRSMVTECLAMLRPSMSPDLQVQVQMEECPPVDGDPAQVHQVLVNLCINAVEAMPERGTLTIASSVKELPEPWLSGLSLPAGAYVELSVVDTGLGMSEEVRRRIFEPFFTTKNSSGPAAGTGLGLSTTYGIVQAHRGAITVESVRGRGSTFRVLLPVGVLPAAEKEPAAPSPKGHGMVLLAEDEPLLRELGGSVLESLGYQVLLAEDGEEALRSFREHHGDLCAVLLDLKMPRMSGREAFIEMRRINPAIPVIVCTGYGDNEEVQALLTLGASGMLAKPYRIAELAAKLEGVLAN
jgi:PAS domain S-box-containing protein